MQPLFTMATPHPSISTENSSKGLGGKKQLTTEITHKNKKECPITMTCATPFCSKHRHRCTLSQFCIKVLMNICYFPGTTDPTWKLQECKENQ